MENPFQLSDDQLKQIIDGYNQWLSANSKESSYAQTFRKKAEKIRADFLKPEALEKTSDDDLYGIVYEYSRSLEGPAYIRLGEPRIKAALKQLRNAFDYITNSNDSPFIIAQNILDGDYKIDLFAKSFWSPILQARFPDELPNWNNKTERFLKRIGVNISTSKLTVAEKYELLSDSFKYLSSFDNSLDFYTLNHLMHYGTEITEGKRLIRNFIPDEKDPVSEMIEKYKARIRQTKIADELYKWQLTKKYAGRPDIKADDFAEEYKSINYFNLIYHNAKGVGNHIAKERTEQFREQFKKLFDDTIDLQTRVVTFDKETQKIYREIWTKESDSHHQDERTISAYLAYFDANTYPLYKDSYYRKYCKILGEKVGSKRQKYVHYIELLDDFIQTYITSDEELLNMVQSFIPVDGHEDQSHYILAQDILYQMLDQDEKETPKEVTKYWLYAPGENAELWEEFYAAGIMGLGWNQLGDLSQYNTKADIEKKLQEIENTTKSKRNNATANYEFKNGISLGDVIIVKKGRGELLGYGIVESDYYFDESRDRYKSCRKVDWKRKGAYPVSHSLALKTLTDITKYDTNEPGYVKYYEYLMAVVNGEYDPPVEIVKTETETDQNISLNTILYGPPGTGKTYHTVDMAVKIAAADLYELDNHEANKQTYDQLLREGQIVFTTFHQSMCYEDFVEGIKPEPPTEERDNLTYEVKDGIFQQIVTNALFEYVGKGERKELKGTYSFTEAFTNYTDKIKEALENNEEVWLKTRSGSEMEIIDITDRENMSLRHKDKEKTYIVSKRRLEKLYTEIPDINSLGNINEEFRKIIGGCNSSAYWAVLNMLRSEKSPVPSEKTSAKIDYESKKLAVSKLKSSDIILDDTSIKKYVLIIDEINRGNVSEIFGELITLIEDDKRFGHAEGIEATLPYSKSRFVIPPNLYIVGTMNTADRSVEALDTALRRRFAFLERMPNYDLSELANEIEGISLSNLLEIINYRIEKILDRDHQIGHSYFMKVKDIEGLQKIFKDRIIPLLQEYFFGDYEKMGLILGSGFICKNGNDNIGFADFPIDDPEIYEKPIYEIRMEPFSSDPEFVEALESLINN